MTFDRRGAGSAAERLAAQFLEAQGLKILERNFRCRAGEVDLIARDGRTIVFVEVRLRGGSAFGGAAASVDPRKQTKVLRAARYYLAGKPEQPCRCDVVALDRLAADRIQWIRDAFSA